MKHNYDMFVGDDLVIADKILRRRFQMMVHSYLYYEMNTNLITDRQFDTWGRELVKLQADYPEISKQVEYYEAFANWDASTGFDLPKDERIQHIAWRLTHCSQSNNTIQKVPRKSLQSTKKVARKSLF